MSTSIPTPAFEPGDFLQRWTEYEARAAELHPDNKTSLFAALRHVGITTVVVTFDGGGDSGQIESIEARIGDDAADIPATPVEIARLDFHATEPERLTEPLGEAIETLAYAFLEQTMAAGGTTRAPLASLCSTSPERRSRSTITSGSRPPKTTPTSFEEATMGHCYHHALSSVKKWGGTAEDYLPLHQWFDESKAITADFRHRALRHHAEGIFMLERFFGATITVSTGRVVPVRLIGEQHVREDLGFIPSFADWVRCIRPEPWMGRAQPIHRDVDPFAITADDPDGRLDRPNLRVIGASS